MKDIEQNFKDSLGNYELPYNAEAWSSLSSKLDVEMPVSQGTAPAASKLKWFIASSSVIILSIATYFLIFHDRTGTGTESNTENNPITNNETSFEKASNERSNSKSEDTPEDIKVANSNSSGSVESESNSADSQVNNKTVRSEEKEYVNANDVANENSNSNENIIVNDNDGKNESIETDNNKGSELNNTSGGGLSIPFVEDVCEGASFKINNTNEVPLLVSGSGVQITLPANTIKTISIEKEGNYILRTLNGHLTEDALTFRVKRAPIVDFTIDRDTKFDNGLPTTIVNTDVIGERFEWRFNKQRVTGRSAAAHFYAKGDQDIELTVTANNGCTTTAIKSLYIDKKYNLMAENAFVPTDNDPRNSTFMPYALTVRDVNFTLIVLDPTDGHMVYKTSDSSKGWDGTDMKTGRPVAYERSYIWKVVILNTEPNEQNEYGGNIIPIQSK